MVGDQGLAALRGGGACDRGTRPCPRLSPAPCTRSPSPPPGGTLRLRGPALESPRLATATRSWRPGAQPCGRRSAACTGARAPRRAPRPRGLVPAPTTAPVSVSTATPGCVSPSRAGRGQNGGPAAAGTRKPSAVVPDGPGRTTEPGMREPGGAAPAAKPAGRRARVRGDGAGGPGRAAPPVNGKHRPRARVASRKHPSADRRAGAAGTQEPPEGLRAEGALTRETRPSPRRSFRSPPARDHGGRKSRGPAEAGALSRHLPPGRGLRGHPAPGTWTEMTLARNPERRLTGQGKRDATRGPERVLRIVPRVRCAPHTPRTPARKAARPRPRPGGREAARADGVTAAPRARPRESRAGGPAQEGNLQRAARQPRNTTA